MRESAIKNISETRLKVATLICDKLNERFSDSSKGQMLSILANVGVNNAFPYTYEYATQHPDNCDAIIALSKYDRKETVDYFMAKLKDSRSLHRDLIVERLGELKHPELVSLIKPYLSDEDRQVRFQAVNALAAIGGKESALALCEFISDPDEWISMSILRILCVMKELDTIPILIEKYSADTDLRRKALMISFLSRFKSITLLGVFDDALQAKDARLRANAIEAIGNLKLPEEELKKRILPFLNDPNNRIRANAILAMAKIAPEKVKAQIIEMVNSDDIQLRRSAAFILCMVPAIDFLPQAEKLLVDENDTVRKRMIQSLKGFPHGFISDNINKVFKDKNKWIRKYTVDMVATIPAFESTPIINLLKNERSEHNIEACLNFLASHPSDSAMNTLKIHFKDRRLPVVKSLLKSLLAIGGVEEVKKVAPRLEQHDPYVIQILTETLLGAGDLETLNDLLEKFSKIKSQHHMDLILPSLESAVNMIALGEKMPGELLKAFTGNEPEPVAEPQFSPQSLSTPTLTAAQPQIQNQAEIPQAPQLAPVVAIETSSEPEIPVKKKPALPHFKAGLKLYNLGKYKKAIEEFNKSIATTEEAPKSIDLYMGIMLCDEGEFEDASKHLLAYIKVAPESAKANYLLGKCYKRTKDWDKLIEVYEKFVKGELEASDNMKRRIHQDMGTACAITGKCETAVRLLTSLFRLEQDNAELAYYLAMALYKMKKTSEAAVLIEKARKIAPEGKSITKLIANLAQTIRSGLPLN